MDLGDLFDHHLDLPEPGQPLDPSVLPRGGGVCALSDHQGCLIRTLTAQNLRRSLAHRLDPAQAVGQRPKVDLRAIARRVWWQPTFSVFEAWLTYLRIARQLAPDRYRKDLAFGPVWFARVRPEERLPRWVVDKFAFSASTVDVGPFRTREACSRFVEWLEDLFDLCRYYDVLRQAPKGQACAYKGMGRCPAPCDGSVSVDEYRRAVAASVEFARGRSAPRIRQLQEAMRAASAGLQFERAARIRTQIDGANKLLAADGRLHKTPDHFQYLVVQRGNGASRVKPFFVNQGRVDGGASVHVKDLEAAVVEWTDNMRGGAGGSEVDRAVERSEGIWLVSHFVIKGDKAPGLFLPSSGLSDLRGLVARVRERFCKTAQKEPEGPSEVDPAGANELR